MTYATELPTLSIANTKMAPTLSFGITVQDDRGVYQRFDPMADMTGLESARIAQFFAIATMNRVPLSGYCHDFWGFVKEHKLERHFLAPNTFRGTSTEATLTATPKPTA